MSQVVVFATPNVTANSSVTLNRLGHCYEHGHEVSQLRLNHVWFCEPRQTANLFVYGNYRMENP